MEKYDFEADCFDLLAQAESGMVFGHVYHSKSAAIEAAKNCIQRWVKNRGGCSLKLNLILKES